MKLTLNIIKERAGTLVSKEELLTITGGGPSGSVQPFEWPMVKIRTLNIR